MKQLKESLKYSKIFFVIIFYSVFTLTTFSQQVTMAPFQIQSSDFESKILRFVEENPKVSTDEVIKKANELILEDGLNFIFAFDKTTCQKISDFKNDKKNKDKPINLTAKLKSTDGELTIVLLPNVKFPKSNCGNCFVEIPVLSITDKFFITKIRGLNVKFDMPGNFNLSSVALFVNDDSANIKNHWIIPGKSEPFSISSDNKIIYFDFPIGNFSDIALLIYDDGDFQFFKKSNLVISESIKNNKDQGYIIIEKDNKTKTLKFTKICN